MARRYGYGWGRSYSGDRYGGYGRWAPYVPVAERRAQAAASAKSLEKKLGRSLAPIKIEGRSIATSFWGQSWCDNLEAYSDFANRLPRGRRYVRNGSVIDLAIAEGAITALVSGSEIYSVKLSIGKLPVADWKAIQRDCARSISSLIDLLQGRFDKGVMQRLTQLDGGLFPKANEIKMQCSCPDYAGLCKHVAAVLYGVGARLDRSPELLFTLRNVDHLELLSQAVTSDNLDRALNAETGETLESDDLAGMFGIELETSAPPAATAAGQPATSGVAADRSSRRPRRAAAKGPVSPKESEKSVKRRANGTAATPSPRSKPAGQVVGKSVQKEKPAVAVVAKAKSLEKRTLARAAKTSSRRRGAK
jgi:uncharacterized Zn finger protein